jgi:hypothetical protein
MITEGGADGADALLGVRLKTTGKAISEIETLVVRRTPFGRTTFPERLLEPSAAMAQILEPADRGTREDLIKAANGYLDGVSRDDADLIPAADDCVRIENGLQTVLNPDAEGFPETFVAAAGWAASASACARRSARSPSATSRTSATGASSPPTPNAASCSSAASSTTRGRCAARASTRPSPRPTAC